MLDQAFNDFFHHKMESIKFLNNLVITETIRSTSKEKNYQEMDFESLKYRRWFRKLPVFYKIIKDEISSYFFDLLPKASTT